MDAAAELGRNPASKHHIQPEYGDEQADAVRDCRTRLARPKFSDANGDREKICFSLQLTTSKIGNLTRLIHTLLYVMSIHIYVLSRQILESRGKVELERRDLEGPTPQVLNNTQKVPETFVHLKVL